MSAQTIRRSGKTTYKVRWREGDRHRSKTFDRASDAKAFDAKVRLAQRSGELALIDGGAQRLDDFAAGDWRDLYAVPNLDQRTREMYAGMWNRHVMPRLGGLRLRELSPEVCQRFAAELAAQGVGAPQRRKVLSLLASVLQRAVEWGRIASNPMRAVRLPSAKRERAVRPIPPEAVEAIRSDLLAAGRHRDAVLVSVLAYAGLRPGEALGLRWGDVNERTVLIERALADGRVKPTKTRAIRSVRLLAPLRQDLAEYRMACGRPDEEQPIFTRADGALWREDDWRNWRGRCWRPAATAAGFPSARPYDLRHSFVSLLIAEGASVVEVARQAGHAPTMSLDTYAHVFDEASGGERVSAEDAIRTAREVVPPMCPAASSGSVRVTAS